ncbi:HEAT repeat domain-containing protein [Halovenus salina]|uniref:HEAT repeat domain-containing protein n=1 Tax=Halovenus salina TaxID=1510225 RepID=A0ABD5W4H1_9EURY
MLQSANSDRQMSFDDSHGETFLYELARDGQTTEVIGYLKRGSSPAVRKRAAELLGDFADHPDEQRRDEVVQELIEAVKHGDSEEVRSQAINSLVRYGDEAIKRLIDRFSEFNAKSAPRWLIAENLIEWLDDDRPEFRLVAAAGLEWFGDEGPCRHWSRPSQTRTRACAAVQFGRVVLSATTVSSRHWQSG